MFTTDDPILQAMVEEGTAAFTKLRVSTIKALRSELERAQDMLECGAILLGIWDYLHSREVVLAGNNNTPWKDVLAHYGIRTTTTANSYMDLVRSEVTARQIVERGRGAVLAAFRNNNASGFDPNVADPEQRAEPLETGSRPTKYGQGSYGRRKPAPLNPQKYSDTQKGINRIRAWMYACEDLSLEFNQVREHPVDVQKAYLEVFAREIERLEVRLCDFRLSLFPDDDKLY